MALPSFEFVDQPLALHHITLLDHRFDLAGVTNVMQRVGFQNEELLRIHRSLIVNKCYMKWTRYLSKNEYAFKLKNGAQLISGRAYREKIDDFLA